MCQSDPMARLKLRVLGPGFILVHIYKFILINCYIHKYVYLNNPLLQVLIGVWQELHNTG